MRNRINWWKVLNQLDNTEFFAYFGRLVAKCKPGIKCKHISFNRAAYSTLKHFYSTTTTAELCRKLGL